METAAFNLPNNTIVRLQMHLKIATSVFVPSRGFLFFYGLNNDITVHAKTVFVPSRGFLFFYNSLSVTLMSYESFRPLTGISLFLLLQTCRFHAGSLRFRPLTGISLFLWRKDNSCVGNGRFSSPHGDFSFSIMRIVSNEVVEDTVFVPSRGFLFFYRT